MASKITALPILDVTANTLTLLNGQVLIVQSQEFNNWLIDETQIFEGENRKNKAICHVFVDGLMVCAFALVKNAQGLIYYYGIKGYNGKTFKKYIGKYGQIKISLFEELADKINKIIADHEAEHSMYAQLHEEIKQLKLENRRLRKQLAQIADAVDAVNELEPATA